MQTKTRKVLCFLFLLCSGKGVAQATVQSGTCKSKLQYGLGRSNAGASTTVQSGTSRSKLQYGLGRRNAGGSITMQSGTCWSKLPQRVRRSPPMLPLIWMLTKNENDCAFCFCSEAAREWPKPVCRVGPASPSSKKGLGRSNAAGLNPPAGWSHQHQPSRPWWGRCNGLRYV